MTQFLDPQLFAATEELDGGILTSQVIVSAATAMDVLGPLQRASNQVSNVVTILHVTGDGGIDRIKLAICGKDWRRKFDARRIFDNAPRGSKLVIKSLDCAGLEFPPGEKHCLWVPSTQFDWSINKGNNQGDGSLSAEELQELGISEWVLRVHVLVSKDPTIATLRWVAIPLPVADLSRLPGDAKKPGYPVIAISDGEAKMAGVPNPTRNDGIIMYPAIINDGPPETAISLPPSSEVVDAMRGFWGQGTAVRALKATEWHEATKGPQEPNSDRGVPLWAWPPLEDERLGSSDESDISEDEEEPLTETMDEMDRLEALRIAGNVSRELGLDSQMGPDTSMIPHQNQSRRNPGNSGQHGNDRQDQRPPPTEESNSRNTETNLPKSKKRKRVVSPTRKSNDTEVVEVAENGSPLNSSILAESLWPDNFTKAMLNSISLENAMNLRKMQDKQKKDEEKHSPGIAVVKPDKPLKVVNIAEGEDNCKDVLHDCRFSLRPISSAPSGWYADRVEKFRKDRPRNPNVTHLGATQQISSSTWFMANDRRLALTSKHYFADNCGVETKAAKNKTGLKNGKIEMSSEYDYTEVKSMADMLNVVVNYMIVQHMTYQEDYTGILILKVAVKYHLFREGRENALNIFNQFFNRVLSFNSNNCHEKAPADFKAVEDIAKEVMTNWGCPIQPPIFGDILNHNNQFTQVDSGATGVGNYEFARADNSSSGFGGSQRDRNQNAGRGRDNSNRGRDNGNRGQDIGNRGQPSNDNQDSRDKIGKIPKNSSNLRIGGLRVCLWYKKDKGCDKTVENGACSFGELKYQHVCGVVTSIKDGKARLCGRNHPAKDHK